MYQTPAWQLNSGQLLPQENLNSLMAHHFATFITDHDLETLRSANIHSLRIPVTYNTFLPEANRTDKFPKGEARELDM
jgi:aryl-phospho-beta-D-glucosidase BglC (GH1 family)